MPQSATSTTYNTLQKMEHYGWACPITEVPTTMITEEQDISMSLKNECGKGLSKMKCLNPFKARVDVYSRQERVGLNNKKLIAHSELRTHS